VLPLDQEQDNSGHSVAQIVRTIPLADRLACITLDYETDYGDRIGGACNILDSSRKEIDELAATLKELDVPMSAFIRTDILENHARALEVVKQLACDFHCHSHTHNTKAFDSRFEISATKQAFEKHFGAAPVGYRAPLGVLYPGDIEVLGEHGFKFSSSVFPSFRPGKFNNLMMPNAPFLYDNGVVELPFAAVPGLRYTISLSYLKLLSLTMNRLLFATFGLPNVLVFDSHLHDFIVNPQSFSRLPRKLRIAWGINKHRGMSYFRRFVQFLRKEGYQFVTMTQLYERAKGAVK
jgi:peptidoglycan/xylan/chitin deacetylase (PgdA/CDA1 family)